ncbi:MAG: hypothetical protein K9G48_13840 [Reyranella sp.]|nr:hypothetical protein [Reyranella sp.]
MRRTLGRRSMFVLPVALPIVSAAACLPAPKTATPNMVRGVALLRPLPEPDHVIRIVIDSSDVDRKIATLRLALDDLNRGPAERSQLLEHVGG